MFPIAFHLGEMTITWYGVLVAVGFLAGVRLSIVRARRNRLSGAVVERAAFWVIVGGVVGSRVLYVLTDLPHYLAHPALVFNPRDGGLVFLGGLLGALVAGLLVARYSKASFLRYTDVCFPTLGLGHAFGRLGCLAVGCCYGAEAPNLPWAVTFPQSAWVQIAPVGVPLHPVQLYAVAANLAIFAGLSWAYHRRRFDGQITLAYLGLYSVVRILLEFVRGDAARGFLFESSWGEAVSTSQFTSALILVAAVVGWFLLRGRPLATADESDKKDDQ